MGRRRNAAELFCECLSNLGVQVVFGVPGTQSLALYDALRRARFRTVTACSEAGALWMANGYYRASGRPGVGVTIGGPGFALGLPGLAEARSDSAAVLHVVCTAEKKAGRSFQFQELDINAISSRVAKSVYRISSPEMLWNTVSKAYRESLSGEPGPVVLDFPAPVMKSESPSPGKDPEGLQPPGPSVDADTFNSIITKLVGSRKPVLMIGQGAVDAAGDVVRLAESLNAPVITNCSGRGIVPDCHRLLVGSDFSGWGVDLVNELLAESDCIAVLGCKLSHNGSSGFELLLPIEKTIRVDASRESLDANYRVGTAVHGDVRSVIPVLLKEIGGLRATPRGWADAEVSVWKKRFAEKRKVSVPQTTEPDMPGMTGVEELFDQLGKILPDDAIVVTDCGLHQILTRRSMATNRPRGLIAPSDFQSMGFGVPAAIGARYGAPARPVVAIIGDGGLAVTGFELLTAVREGVDLVVIVFCDGYLGQIRADQLRGFGADFGTVVGKINLEAFSGSVGARYVELSDGFPAGLEAAVNMTGVRVLGLRLKDTPQVRAMALERSIRSRVRDIPGVNELRKLARRLRKRSSGD